MRRYFRYTSITVVQDLQQQVTPIILCAMKSIINLSVIQVQGFVHLTQYSLLARTLGYVSLGSAGLQGGQGTKPGKGMKENESVSSQKLQNSTIKSEVNCCTECEDSLNHSIVQNRRNQYFKRPTKSRAAGICKLVPTN